MRTRQQTTRTSPPRIRGSAIDLDDHAAWVAQLLDEGYDEVAWTATRQLEANAGCWQPETDRPPSPVIGRRFAAAHRRMLAVRSATAAQGAAVPQPV